MREETLVQQYLRHKKVNNLLGADTVFARHSATGMGINTMLFQDGGPSSTLYRNVEAGTTYFSYSDDVFKMIDENTTTIKENLEAKNIAFDTMVVANSILEDMSSEQRIAINTEMLLLMVKNKEPMLDFRKVSYLLNDKSPAYEYLLHDKPIGIPSPEMFAFSDSDFEIEESAAGPAVKYTSVRAKNLECGNEHILLNYIPCKFDKGSAEEPTTTDGTVASECSIGEGSEDGEVPSGKGKGESGEEELDTEVELEQLKGSMVEYKKRSGADWFGEEYGGGRYIVDDPLMEKIEEHAKKVSSKLKGMHGKAKVLNPSKKISIKNFIRKNPYMYIKKRDKAKGKNININVIMDVSGSMCGTPVQHAASVALIFDWIAQNERTITGNVILSAGEGSMAIELGKGAKNLMRKIRAFSGSEGIENAINDNMKILQKSKYNICISDAQITDEPINKKAYEAKNVFIDSIYINKTSRSEHHVEHMEEFFSTARVLPDLDAAVEYIINVILAK